MSQYWKKQFKEWTLVAITIVVVASISFYIESKDASGCGAYTNKRPGDYQ